MKTALMIASPLEAVSEDSERFAELPRHVYDCRIKVRVCGPEDMNAKKGAL